MNRYEALQAIHDLASARLRNGPLEEHVEHDLRQIERLANDGIRYGEHGKPVTYDHWQGSLAAARQCMPEPAATAHVQRIFGECPSAPVPSEGPAREE